MKKLKFYQSIVKRRKPQKVIQRRAPQEEKPRKKHSQVKKANLLFPTFHLKMKKLKLRQTEKRNQQPGDLTET